MPDGVDDSEREERGGEETGRKRYRGRWVERQIGKYEELKKTEEKGRAGLVTGREEGQFGHVGVSPMVVTQTFAVTRPLTVNSLSPRHLLRALLSLRVYLTVLLSQY